MYRFFNKWTKFWLLFHGGRHFLMMYRIVWNLNKLVRNTEFSILRFFHPLLPPPSIYSHFRGNNELSYFSSTNFFCSSSSKILKIWLKFGSSKFSSNSIHFWKWVSVWNFELSNLDTLMLILRHNYNICMFPISLVVLKSRIINPARAKTKEGELWKICWRLRI